jgi:predicted ATPase with chaperone activity
VVLAGGELSLDMLDLRYSPEAGVYEAPLQVKAMNGIFVMDDFGRQLVQPRDLLNRWIVPLEKRFDFLHLNTGKKFLLPFDVLVVFSTNLAPEDLMDDAFLRRIPYKIHVGVPTVEDYAEIFRRVCADSDLRIPSGMMDELVRDFYGKQKEPLASYHPKFLIDRVIDSCRYAGTPPYLDTQRLRGAWRNLFVEKGKHKSI